MHDNTFTALALPTLTTADAAFITANAVDRLESLRIEHPYAALPPRCTCIRHAALALGPALVLVRWDMCTHAGDDFNGHARVRVTCGRLERLSVMLWYVHGEELGVVSRLRFACARLGIQIGFERDIRAFGTQFYPGVMNGTTLWTSSKTMTGPKIIPKARRYGDDLCLELLLVTSRNCGALLT